MSNELVTVEYDECLNHTMDAILFCIESGSKPDGEGWKVWLPKSQIENHDDEAKTFDIPEWLALEKGLI